MSLMMTAIRTRQRVVYAALKKESRSCKTEDLHALYVLLLSTIYRELRSHCRLRGADRHYFIRNVRF